MGRQVPGPEASVVEATRAALDAADLLVTDLGTAQVLMRLAQAIDDIDEDGLNPAGKLDNVSVPTYLRYCESLGLTPAGRAKTVASRERAERKVGAAGDDDSSAAEGSALGSLRSIQGGKAG